MIDTSFIRLIFGIIVGQRKYPSGEYNLGDGVKFQ